MADNYDALARLLTQPIRDRIALRAAEEAAQPRPSMLYGAEYGEDPSTIAPTPRDLSRPSYGLSRIPPAEVDNQAPIGVDAFLAQLRRQPGYKPGAGPMLGNPAEAVASSSQPRTPLGLPDDLQSVSDMLTSYGGAATPDYRYSPMPPTSVGGLSPETRGELESNAYAIAQRQKMREVAKVRDAMMMARGMRSQAPTYINPEGQSAVLARQSLLARQGISPRSLSMPPGFTAPATGMSRERQDSAVMPQADIQARRERILGGIDPDRYATPPSTADLTGDNYGLTYQSPEMPRQMQAELDSHIARAEDAARANIGPLAFRNPLADSASRAIPDGSGRPMDIRAAAVPTADRDVTETVSPYGAESATSYNDPTFNQAARTNSILASIKGMSSADRIAMLQRVAPQNWQSEPAIQPAPRQPTTADMIADMRAREGGPTASNAVADARAAMLARNPMLRDRIAAERQLTQRMQPMEVAQANTSDARANALLADARATRASNAARGINPVPIDQELFRAAQAKRAATEDARRQMVSAIARGRQGMYTSQDVMNQMLMRNPQAMAAQLAAQSAGARNATDLQISKNGLEAANTMRMGDREFQAGQDKARWEAEARLRQIVPGTQVAATNLEKSKIIGRISALKDLRNQSPPAKQLEYDAQIKALEGEINGINSFQQQAAPVQGGDSPGMISTAPPTRRSAMDVAKMLVAGGRQGEKLSEFLQRARMEKDNLSDSDPTGVAALDLLSNHIRSTFPGEIDAEKANTYPSLWNRGYYREYQPGGTLSDNPPLRLAEGVRDASLIAPFITNLVGAAGRGVGAFEGESNDAYNRRLWARGLLNRRPR